MATKVLGTLGNIDTLTIGGRVFTDLTNLIILEMTANTGSGVVYSTFRLSNSSSGYQVTSGKTFTIYAIQATSLTSTARISLGYGNTDVGNDSSSAPTSFVAEGHLIVAASPSAEPPRMIIGGGSIVNFVANFSIPSLKYPCFVSDGSGFQGSAFIYGYEV